MKNFRVLFTSIFLLIFFSCINEKKIDDEQKELNETNRKVNLDSINNLICCKVWREDYSFHPYKRKKDKYYAILDEYIHKDSATHSDTRHRVFLIYDLGKTNNMYVKSSFDYISESEYIISDTLIQRYQSTWSTVIIDSSVYIHDNRRILKEAYKEVLFLNEETMILALESRDSDGTTFCVYTDNEIPFNQSEIEEDNYFIVPIIRKYYKDRGLEFRILNY